MTTQKTWLRSIAGILLGLSALYQLFSNSPWWFIDGVNLIFHESGHLIFMFFGTTISILGGSFMEILVPLMITIHFINHRQFFSASFGFWWLSTAFLSVSIYAADAQERILPLLGGDNVGHDWYNLLTGWGLLQYDDLFGYFFWLCGLVSTVFLFYYLYKDKSVKETGETSNRVF